jgi:hypothetical protein
MNSNYEQQLESEISKELRALPELEAPSSLANRVMTALEHRSRVPWYRRSWQTWPVAWQATSLVAMLVLFGGLCVAGWELSQTEVTMLAVHRVGQWISGFSVIGHTLDILANSALLVVKKLGTGFIVGGFVIGGLGYAMCMGLGTVYFRLAFAKR